MVCWGKTHLFVCNIQVINQCSVNKNYDNIYLLITSHHKNGTASSQKADFEGENYGDMPYHLDLAYDIVKDNRLITDKVLFLGLDVSVETHGLDLAIFHATKQSERMSADCQQSSPTADANHKDIITFIKVQNYKKLQRQPRTEMIIQLFEETVVCFSHSPDISQTSQASSSTL